MSTVFSFYLKSPLKWTTKAYVLPQAPRKDLMTTKELVDYLLNFKDETEVHILCANPKERCFYGISAMGMMSPEAYEHPILLLEVGSKELFEETEAVELNELTAGKAHA